MPFDPAFQSNFKGKGHRTLIPEESVELQLGRSDYLLGEPQSRCPFPMPGPDAAEWTRGWLLEHQKTKALQEAVTALYPPWKTKSSKRRKP